LARSEYLKAQNDYHQAKITRDLASENLAFLIADEIGTKYTLNETLDYRIIKMTLDESFNAAAKNNPTLLNNKTTIENAERSYDVAVKENMPLPKFTMNLGAYNKKFGPTTNRTVYETYSGSGNVELVASLNATWSLTGANGFFNSNKLAEGRIGKEIALREYEKNTHFTKTLIRQTYKSILSLQNQIVILEARLPTLQKSFDTILENYLSGKTKYSDFHLILQELTETKILYEQYKMDHLSEKLNLAKLAGLEDFPGENFEQLAVKTQR
jgi:outer membrane protein TolC